METVTVEGIFAEFFDFYEENLSWDNDAVVSTRVNGTWVVATEDLSPYDILVPFVYHGMDSVSVLTMHGWAAPANEVDDEHVRPSQHVAKRRMRMYIMMNCGVCRVAIKWNDTDVVEIMNDNGAGALADAIDDIAYVYTQSLLEGKLVGGNPE